MTVDTQAPPSTSTSKKDDVSEVKKEKPPETLKEFEKAAKKAYSVSDFILAIQHYEKVLEFGDADRARITSNICQCYMKLNQWTDAYNAAKKAIEFDDQNVKAWYRLGLILLAMRQYSLAQETLEKACNNQTFLNSKFMIKIQIFKNDDK